MTDHDAHEFAWLAAWIATADLPADLYRLPLDPWGWATLLVADPALSHRHLRETVAGHPVGQVRAAALVRMRLLRRLAGRGRRADGGGEAAPRLPAQRGGRGLTPALDGAAQWGRDSWVRRKWRLEECPTVCILNRMNGSERRDVTPPTDPAPMPREAPMSEHTTPAPVSAQGQVEYRDVPGFPGYRVGSDGSVWSCREPVSGTRLSATWHPIKPHPRNGYPRVKLQVNGRGVSRFVHTLILEAFVGPCPEGMECRHLDGDPTNARPGNLCWGTHKENAADAIRHGRTRRGSGHGRAKLSEADVRKILAAARNGEGSRRLAKRYGVCRTAIKNILRGLNWKHVSAGADGSG